MNPLQWTREHRLAWAVMCTFGAVAGVLLGFIHSQFFSLTRPGQMYEFGHWLSDPQTYWPWPLLGFFITGVTFYAVQLIRKSN